MSKQTMIVISEDGTVEVTTTSTKWVNHMAKLVKEGHAEEIETNSLGQAFKFDAKLLRLPFHREPREFTDEQRQAARERLAGVRAKTAAKKEKAAAKSEPPVKPPLSKSKVQPAKK